MGAPYIYDISHLRVKEPEESRKLAQEPAASPCLMPDGPVYQLSAYFFKNNRLKKKLN